MGTAVDAGSQAERDGDLSRDDRLRIEDHLDACGDCRRRRSALLRSMSLLSAAATESPVEPHAPSLWQGVAARIEAHEAAPPSLWSRISRALLPASARTATDRATDRLDRIRESLPIQLAWMRDSIVHDLPDRLRAALERDARSSARLGDRILGSLTSPAGLGAAALATVVVVAFSLAHRSETESEARIAAQSAPISIPSELQAVPLVLSPARAETLEAAETRAQESESSSSEPEALAQNSAPLQPPAAAPAPASAVKPAAVRVYDYDLERGIPMPPDARTGKPAY